MSEDLAGLDLAAALGRVGGDEELLREIAQIFLEQCPDAVSEVRQAVEAKDPDALQNAAHSLKGSVGNFGAQAAFDAAYSLEIMGREGDLTGSNQALLELESAIVNLTPQLAQLVEK